MSRISGWAYQAELVCNDCMKEIARKRTLELGDATDYRNESAEEVVRAWALAEGLDPEARHDTNRFPHPIFSTDEEAVQGCNLVGCTNTLIET